MCSRRDASSGSFHGRGSRGRARSQSARCVCCVGTRAPACASPRTSTIIFYVAWASRVSIERSISKRTLSYQRQRSTQPRFSVRLREPRDGVGRRVGSGRRRAPSRRAAADRVGRGPAWAQRPAARRLATGPRDDSLPVVIKENTRTQMRHGRPHRSIHTRRRTTRTALGA